MASKELVKKFIKAKKLFENAECKSTKAVMFSKKLKRWLAFDFIKKTCKEL